MMPRVHALWMTCVHDGLDHLVTDAEVGGAGDVVGERRFRTLCGRSILSAALVCEPLPRCRQCGLHIDDDPGVTRKPRQHRSLTRWLSRFAGTH